MIHVKGEFLKLSSILNCRGGSGLVKDVLQVEKPCYKCIYLGHISGHHFFHQFLEYFPFLGGSSIVSAFRHLNVGLGCLFSHHAKRLSSLLPVVTSSHVELNSRCYYLPIILALGCLNLSKPG